MVWVSSDNIDLGPWTRFRLTLTLSTFTPLLKRLLTIICTDLLLYNNFFLNSNNCLDNEQNSSIYHFLGDVKAFKAFNFDSYKLDSCGAQKDIALWANLLGPLTGTLENCHNGPYFPEPSYKPTGTIWCPFDFYRTSVDAEVLYAALFGVNLPTVDTFARQNLSFPGCWAYPDSK